MKEYYAHRAPEYEEIYQRPERQESIKITGSILTGYFKGRRVLETACGTGFWTEVISKSAEEITACDINNGVIEIAKTKTFYCPVKFIIADAFSFKPERDEYNAFFAGFWISHILKEKMEQFTGNLHQSLSGGSRVCFIDNKYVEGSSTKISKRDCDGNTYQIRTLKNGESSEVVKNYPDKNELISYINKHGRNINYLETDYYWILQYEIQGNALY